ncbi:MAG TPA: MarR family transcriptional regulator [Lysobacter sp.]|nr:MarR family transcriptional regulator [Lysobacter sp.]
MAKPASKPSTNAALQQDAEALHAAVSDLVRIYQFRDRDTICCYDVSVTQCYALEVLVERGASRSQALADALRLDKSTTTRVVDALVRKGYVERLPDPDDARAVSLRVTREGRKLYEKINGELIAQQIELLRDLDPEARAGATEILRRLARAAQARFVSGVSVGSCAPACGPDDRSSKCG